MESIQLLVLTRIYGKVIWEYCYKRNIVLKRDENGEWRKLHNEELHSLYLSSNIAKVTKSRTLRWAGHVAIMEKR